jgi:endonuclease/exonuclease/phosphatase family metal-dependent hydrolase
MRLRILSYNIHRAIGLDRRFRPNRIAKIILYHNAHIVLLQEVDVGVPRSKWLDLSETLAELTGYPYRAIGLNVKLRKGMYGNATLSRYPIIEKKNIDLTIDKRKSRGCLYTQVSLPSRKRKNKTLSIFNLHLGISFKERPLQLGLIVRSPEFAGLDVAAPCIIAGDFNDFWKRLAPMLTEILGFDCATNRKYGYQNAILTYPSFSPANGLDKIFCRGINIVNGKRCRLRSARVASDHLPVVADLII